MSTIEFATALLILLTVFLFGLKLGRMEVTFTEQQQINLSKQQWMEDKLETLRLENDELRNYMTSQDRKHQTEVKDLHETDVLIADNVWAQQQEIEILISAQRGISSEVVITVVRVRQLINSLSINVSSLHEAHVDLSNRVDTTFDELLSRLNTTEASVSKQITDLQNISLRLTNFHKEWTTNLTQLSGQIKTLTEHITCINDTVSLLHTGPDTQTDTSQDTEPQTDTSQAQTESPRVGEIIIAKQQSDTSLVKVGIDVVVNLVIETVGAIIPKPAHAVVRYVATTLLSFIWNTFF